MMSHAPGLTARLDVDGAVLLSTADGAWPCTNATEHANGPIAWSSLPDVINNSAPIGAWTGAAAYDDGGWERASAAAAPPGGAWGALDPAHPVRPSTADAYPLSASAAVPIAVAPVNSPPALSLIFFTA
jgi:hypothetical protein